MKIKKKKKSENSVANLHRNYRLRDDMDLKSPTVHAFSWINFLLRPLRHDSPKGSTLFLYYFPLKTYLEAVKFSWVTCSTSLILQLKNVHATLDCWNPLI